MGKSRRKFLCLSCTVDVYRTDGPYYLKDEIWGLIHNSRTGMYCIGCAEKILKRSLNSDDFTDCWINNPKKNQMSSRLLDRITNGKSK